MGAYCAGDRSGGAADSAFRLSSKEGAEGDLACELEALRLENALLRDRLDSDPRWGNTLAEYVWSHVSVFALGLIMDHLEPQMKAEINGLHFDRESCHLGGKPVRWDDIRISRSTQEVPEGKISNLVLKGTLAWDGDLSVRMRLHSVPFGIYNLSIKGEMVVELVGMLTRFPIFDGGRLFFLDPPELTLQFQGVAEILNIGPLKAKMLRLITNAFCAVMVLPNRTGIRLHRDVDMFRITHPYPEGILWVTVWSAQELPAMDSHVMRESTSDPAVEVRCGAVRVTSATHRGTLSPLFDLQVPLLIAIGDRQQVHIIVLNKHRSSESFMGSLRLSVAELVTWGQERRTLELADSNGIVGATGKVTMSSEWRPLERESQGEAKLKAIQQASGLVFVGIYSARGLPGAEEGTRLWVTMQTTQLLGSQEKLETSRTPQERQVLFDAKQLQRKLELVEKYGIPLQDAAELLGVDLKRNGGAVDPMRRVTRGGTAELELAASSQGSAEWDEGFHMLVGRPAEASLRLDLWRQGPSGQEQSLGGLEVRIADVAGSGTQDLPDHVLRLPGTAILLRVRLQVHLFGAASESPSRPSGEANGVG